MPSDSFNDFPWSLVFLWLLIELAVLYRILTRRDFDTPARILWVIVVIFVPFFGVLLYWAAAPAERSTQSATKTGAVNLNSDTAGTPWAGNPGFSNDESA